MIWVVIASVLFGINPTLLAASVGRGMDSVCQIFWTSLVNCCVNLLLLLRSEECSGLRLKGRTAAILAGSGILGMGLTGSLLSVSYQLIGTGTSTVIHFMYPAVVSAAAWIFFRKKPGRRKILSILLSVCGVALMAQVDEKLSAGVSYIPAIFSSFTYGTYLLINDCPLIKGQPLSVRCAWMCLGSCLSLGLYLAVTGRFTWPPDGASLAMTLLSGFVAAGAYRSLVYGVGRIGAVNGAIATLFEPLTSVVMGILTGGETLTVQKGAGCGVILLSVFLSSL